MGRRVGRRGRGLGWVRRRGRRRSGGRVRRRRGLRRLSRHLNLGRLLRLRDLGNRGRLVRLSRRGSRRRSWCRRRRGRGLWRSRRPGRDGRGRRWGRRRQTPGRRAPRRGRSHCGRLDVRRERGKAQGDRQQEDAKTQRPATTLGTQFRRHDDWHRPGVVVALIRGGADVTQPQAESTPVLPQNRLLTMAEPRVRANVGTGRKATVESRSGCRNRQSVAPEAGLASLASGARGHVGWGISGIVRSISCSRSSVVSARACRPERTRSRAPLASSPTRSVSG